MQVHILCQDSFQLLFNRRDSAFSVLTSSCNWHWPEIHKPWYCIFLLVCISFTIVYSGTSVIQVEQPCQQERHGKSLTGSMLSQNNDLPADSCWCAKTAICFSFQVWLLQCLLIVHYGLDGLTLRTAVTCALMWVIQTVGNNCFSYMQQSTFKTDHGPGPLWLALQQPPSCVTTVMDQREMYEGKCLAMVKDSQKSMQATKAVI